MRKEILIGSLIAVAPVLDRSVYAAEDQRTDFILAAPQASQQPQNQWFTAVWGVPRSENKDILQVVPHGYGKVLSGSGNQTPIEVSKHGNFTNVVINTYNAVPESGRLLSVVPKRLFVPALEPWARGQNGLTFSVKLRLAGYEGYRRSVSYITAMFGIKNPTNKKSFWFGVSLFDPRGDEKVRTAGHWRKVTPDTVACSPSHGTSLPIVSTIASPTAHFIKLDPNSSTMMTESSEKTAVFKFTIARENILEILKELSRQQAWCLSDRSFGPDDLDNMQLTESAVLVESYIGDRNPEEEDKNEFSRIAVEISQPKISRDKN